MKATSKIRRNSPTIAGPYSTSGNLAAAASRQRGPIGFSARTGAKGGGHRGATASRPRPNKDEANSREMKRLRTRGRPWHCRPHPPPTAPFDPLPPRPSPENTLDQKSSRNSARHLKPGGCGSGRVVDLVFVGRANHVITGSHKVLSGRNPDEAQLQKLERLPRQGTDIQRTQLCSLNNKDEQVSFPSQPDHLRRRRPSPPVRGGDG
jgi:hypothetical protein